MRKPLTRDAILDAAIELLDRDGMAGLSMRKLGAAVGVEAMSLYNHVPNKDALLDGIHERILLSLDAPTHTRTWQAFVRHQALALHRALQQHPNAIPLFATRPASTSASMDRLERYLEVLSRAGFKPIDTLSIVQLVAQPVVGHAMWTNGVAVVLIGRDAPPHVKQLNRALEKWNPDRELEMGIDALVHGFERLVD